MPNTDLLHQFGLQRNPFVDRTAERTKLDTAALYVQSDLRCFEPSATTYVFFGRRGAGKTTVRLMVRKIYIWLIIINFLRLFSAVTHGALCYLDAAGV